ncbi:hypothetical protein EII20_08430 [Comamonadaceae bacterium OH2545_COT-014]|nr:hypothetical protein EII20_08430 [Comamonadaceae bacterium OH2545_COT-014]
MDNRTRITYTGEAGQQRPAPAPFWQRLNHFFRFPLQPDALVRLGLIALGGLLAQAMAFFGGLLGFAVLELCLVFGTVLYAMRIMTMGAGGIMRAADFRRQYQDADLKYMPLKLFALTMAAGLLLEGAHRAGGPRALWLAALAVSFATPAGVVALVQTGRFFAALNPLRLFEIVRAIGLWPYALLCGFLYLLNVGLWNVMGLALTLGPQWLVLGLFHVVYAYFAWVMASLMGYVMFQYHEALDLDLLPGAERLNGHADSTGVPDTNHAANDIGLPPAVAARREADAHVGRLVGEGNWAGAERAASEYLRQAPDDAAAHRRYHRVLLLADDPAALLQHAHEFIALLMRYGEKGQAIEVWQACREKDPAFALRQGADALALARYAWQGGQTLQALAFINGFDRRYKDSPGAADLTPQAYALAVRVLIQGLGRADQAQPIVRTLQARYPGHAATEEALWLLRQPVLQGGNAPRPEEA